MLILLLLLVQVLNLEPEHGGTNAKVTAATWGLVVTDRLELEQMLATVEKFSCCDNDDEKEEEKGDDTLSSVSFVVGRMDCPN